MYNNDKHDYLYLDLLKKILNEGITKTDRTGTGTISIFGHMMKYDVSKYIPVLTTKQLHTKSIIHELLWFISGNTNIKYLQENGVKIWDDWADENGNLGPVYGEQWRNWKTEDSTIDQLQLVINEIKNNPHSRRLLISSWNAPLIWSGKMKLPPCHFAMQFILENGTISLMWSQRSVDTMLGLPFNMASYAIFLHMIGSITGYKPKNLICSLGDTHIYLNHLEQVKLQLSRIPFQSPTLWINPNIKNINDFKFDDIKIGEYNSHDRIKAPIAV